MKRREFLIASALTLSSCLTPKPLIDGNYIPGKIYIPSIMNKSGPDYIYLPRYLVTNPGKVYEDFEDINDWSVVKGNLLANPDQYKSGKQSLRLVSLPGETAAMVKTVDWDLSGDWGRLQLWMYVNHAVSDYSDNFTLSLSNDANFTHFYSCHLYNLYNTIHGWNTMTWAKGDMEAHNSPSWSDPIVRVRLQCEVDKEPARSVDVSFDSLSFGIHSIAGAEFAFDDGSNQQYDNAFLYMKQLGIRGNLWAETDLVGVDSDYLSWTKVKEMAAAGWTIGNHTNSRYELEGQSEIDQEAQVKGGYDTLNQQGLSKGSHYVAYPTGHFDENTMTAMANLSMLTGRTTKPTTQQGEPMFALPFEPMYVLPSNEVNSNTTVAFWKGLIDRAISGGYIMPFHWHKVGESVQMSTQDFRTCMDYFKSKKDAGLIYDLTIDDIYELTLDSVRIPK